MSGWEKKFTQTALDKGRERVLNNRVQELKRMENGYSAAVLGKERYEVKVIMKEGRPSRISCRCPVARGGGLCEHMAAVLYAIELQDELQEAKEKSRKLYEQKQEEEQKKQAEREEAERRIQAAKEAAERKAREEKAEAARKAQAAKEEARRQAREKRKLEKERRKAEQARKAEEAMRQAQELFAAEQARKEKAEQERAAEEARRAEKKRLEEEARRIADAKREAQEQRAGKQEAKRTQEQRAGKQEAKRTQEQRAGKQEAKRAQEQRAGKQEAKRVQKQEAEKNGTQEAKKAQMRNGSAAVQALPGIREFSEEEKKKFEVLGSPEKTSEEERVTFGEKRIREMESYSYYDVAAIRKDMGFTRSDLRKGEELYQKGEITLENITEGYLNSNGVRCGELSAKGTSGNQSFSVTILFSRTEAVRRECGCPQCRKKYYWYKDDNKCVYLAAATFLLEDYLKQHPLGDATDLKGRRLIGSFQKRRANMLAAGAVAQEESLNVVPRLTNTDNGLQISFRVGEGKLFVIKNLGEFCRNVKESATATYGSSTQINHRLENFKEGSKKWIRFINQAVTEEELFEQQLRDRYSTYPYQQKGVGSSLRLSGWRLDEVYRRMSDEVVDYEDKTRSTKVRGTLICGTGNPRVSMKIEPLEDKGFQGVRVNGTMPELFYGVDAAYFIGEGELKRIDPELTEILEPLDNLSYDRSFFFHVGRRELAEFYYRILPRLREYTQITEKQAEKIRTYLVPQVEFVFYLDAEEGDVTCRVRSRYGDEERSTLDIMREDTPLEVFRDEAREEEVLFQTLQMLPAADLARDELSCGGDEERMYQMMEHGTEDLLQMGEVRCTSRFRNYQVIRRVKVSVGVSVSSGMLDLDITTEDVSREELLDILQSYRTKKKYYRLKDGSFVNLGDQSLEMLAELMDSMHLKPKEFVQGKMHLPAYRTLYLDKMLEENSEVYSSRDSHFRQMVKGFKTIHDADFEEPASLSRIMRTYQKNGYKWLRTLEQWRFGGILADDMGLGKTLQMIAVLLAAKQEGRKGTALVVTPAALVFNWGEELNKFAPELTVSLVTGTQGERQAKIEAYQDFDVLVTSYDLLKRDILHYEGKQFLYQVIDEAQYIKNHTTAAAKAVKVVNSQVRFALTGTPIENRLSELWSIFDYLMPGFLYSYEVFKREMETPIVKNKDEDAMKRLQKMTAPFILRRLKEDVLKDLPEKLEEVRYVKFDSDQQKLYDGQVLHMKEQIARQDEDSFNKNKLQILAELTRLRQICCDPELCFENYRGESAKAQACLQLVQSAMDGGHRMLLFSQFTSMLEILQGKLKEAEIPFYTITGATPKEKRLQLVTDFNNGEVPVFLISLKAGGVGLNLTGADVVIHYDPWWNLAAQNQATDRAHRIGQKKKVTVYKLIAKNSIEEKILHLQETKRDLADQIIGGETGQLGGMTREDFLELLQTGSAATGR